MTFMKNSTFQLKSSLYECINYSIHLNVIGGQKSQSNFFKQYM